MKGWRKRFAALSVLAVIVAAVLGLATLSFASASNGHQQAGALQQSHDCRGGGDQEDLTVLQPGGL